MNEARKTEIKQSYAEYATKNLVIDEDNDGMYVQVPSEKDKEVHYTVRCTESACSVVVKSCGCVGNKDYGRFCKHCIIVQQYFNVLYKNNAPDNTKAYRAKQAAKAARVAKINAEVEAVKAETAKHNTPEKLDAACQELREMKSVKVGQPGSVALAGKPKSNWDTTAALNGSRVFSVLR
jgi:hypothetical protein